MVKCDSMHQVGRAASPQRVLHIGGNLANARIVREALLGAGRQVYDVEWVETLTDGLERLALNQVSVILVDVDLPDPPGASGLETLLKAAPAQPVLVVGRDERKATARRVIQAGAFEYLLTCHLDNYWLPHALQHAIQWKRSAAALSEETERAGVTLNSIGDAFISTDTSGRIAYLNSIAEAMTGWTRSEAAGQLVHEVVRIVKCTTREPIAGWLDPSVAQSDARKPLADCTLIGRDGTESAVEYLALPIHDHDGQASGSAIVLRDTGVARALTSRMAHLASHDALTDLPNRLLLRDRLDRALALSKRHDRRLAVLYLDIDHFKYINDSLGHAIGDQLLQRIAREVTQCVRSSDTISREGGDEFVVVLAELAHPEDAAVGARKILAAVSRPHMLEGHELHVTASIGISVYPNDGGDAEALLQRADLALHQAKEQGRNDTGSSSPAWAGARPNGRPSKRICTPPSIVRNSCSTTSPRSTCSQAPSSVPKRSSAGAIPIEDWSRPSSSCRSPKTAALSGRSAAGSCRRPAGRRARGRTPDSDRSR